MGPGVRIPHDEGAGIDHVAYAAENLESAGCRAGALSFGVRRSRRIAANHPARCDSLFFIKLRSAPMATHFVEGETIDVGFRW